MSTSTNVANIPIWQNLSLENLPNEIWKPVVGYEESYLISSLGRVKSLSGRKWVKKDRILRQGKNKGGYLSVMLYASNRKPKRIMTHLLVSYSFLSHKSKRGYVVDHINNVKEDNHIKNLQVITERLNNIKDSKRTNTGVVGVSKTKYNNFKTCIYNKDKEYFLGNHKSIKDAKLAYNKALDLIIRKPLDLEEKLTELSFKLRPTNK